jgi:hypothetical protein
MDIRATVDTIGLSVDALGVGVIVTAIAIAGLGFIRGLLQAEPFAASYRQMRVELSPGSPACVASRLVRTSARSMR